MLKQTEKGFALFITMIILLIIVAMGSLTFMFVQHELKDTARDLKRSKSVLVADAALDWGLYLAQKSPAWSKATHDSTGENLLDSSKYDTFSLHDTNAFYRGCSLVVDDSGWITNKPNSIEQSMYGTLNEEIAFKVWYLDTLVIRIIGRGIVEGDTSETALLGNY